MDKIGGRTRDHRISLILAVGLLTIGLAYLAQKSLFSHDHEVDFRFIWLAGRLWSEGVDPYSPAYLVAGRAIFSSGNEIAYWLYPPQWWPICRTLAWLSVDDALLLWRTGNALLLLGAATLLAYGVRHAHLGLSLPFAIGFVALACLMEATPQTLAIGQTSILVFAGFCFVSYALLVGSEIAMAIGLILLCLKPHFGLAALAPLACMPRWWRAIAVALALSLLAALPQLTAYGLPETLSGFLRNLSLHATLAPNQPDKLTGLTQILIRTTGLRLPTVAAAALAILVGVAAVFTLRKHPWPDATKAAALGLTIVTASIFLLPLHSYDFIAALPAALLVLPFEYRTRLCVWAGLAVLLKPGLIAKVAGFGAPTQIGLLTLAALLLATGAFLALRENRRRHGSGHCDARGRRAQPSQG